MNESSGGAVLCADEEQEAQEDEELAGLWGYAERQEAGRGTGGIFCLLSLSADEMLALRDKLCEDGAILEDTFGTLPMSKAPARSTV